MLTNTLDELRHQRRRLRESPLFLFELRYRAGIITVPIQQKPVIGVHTGGYARLECGGYDGLSQMRFCSGAGFLDVAAVEAVLVFARLVQGRRSASRQSCTDDEAKAHRLPQGVLIR